MRGIDVDSFRSEAAAVLSSPNVNDTDLLTLYNEGIRKLLDSHAPLVTRIDTNRPSAPGCPKA